MHDSESKFCNSARPRSDSDDSISIPDKIQQDNTNDIYVNLGLSGLLFSFLWSLFYSIMRMLHSLSSHCLDSYNSHNQKKIDDEFSVGLKCIETWNPTLNDVKLVSADILDPSSFCVPHAKETEVVQDKPTIPGTGLRSTWSS